jgi:Domain of Unknown Function (DUF1521)
MMMQAISNQSVLRAQFDDVGMGNDNVIVAPNLIRDVSRSAPMGLPLDAPTQIPAAVSVAFTQPKLITEPELMPKILAARFGGAKLDLGQGYRLTVDERDQSLLFENGKTASQTIIWGNAKIAGNTVSEPLQFWGTTSFAFGDEGKITLETVESKSTPGQYLLDTVSVSVADRGVVITGLTNDVVGDLKIDESKSGGRVDNNARDGFTLFETEDGASWVDDDNAAITQALLDATGIGGLYGPGSEFLNSVEFSALMSRFMTSWNLFSMISSFSRYSTIEPTRSVETKSDVDRASERKIVERLMLEQALIRRSAEMPRMFG